MVMFHIVMLCYVSLPEGTTNGHFRYAAMLIKHDLLENDPFISDFPIENSICNGFSMAMFDYQRVNQWIFI